MNSQDAEEPINLHAILGNPINAGYELRCKKCGTVFEIDYQQVATNPARFAMHSCFEKQLEVVKKPSAKKSD
jgi:hypothetical protein